MKTIGFIGCGNMGSAMIGGIIAAGICDGAHLYASAPSMTNLTPLKDKYDIQISNDNISVAAHSDILFLAVKPAKFTEIIPEIRDAIRPDTIIVSIAAGKSISDIEALFGKDIRLIRSMPNTPALVGEAMSALCVSKNITPDETAEIEAIFNSFGKCEIVQESLMDCVTGVSGSSPAYVYMFIEAMADGAVADGMPRAQAYKFAAQSVLGAAKMVLETGSHPGVLKDAVCSPGGTTIEAVAQLETGGLRSTVINAQRACVNKSKNMH